MTIRYGDIRYSIEGKRGRPPTRKSLAWLVAQIPDTHLAIEPERPAQHWLETEIINVNGVPVLMVKVYDVIRDRLIYRADCLAQQKELAS